MKFLFVTAHPYLPQMYGGLQTSTDQLCRALMEKGHAVAVLAALIPDGWFGLKARVRMQINKRLSNHKLTRDDNLGYPVWRTWHPWEVLGHVAAEEKPDLIILTTGKIVPLARAAKVTGIPIVAQLHDVRFDLQGGDFKELENIPCIANSQFTAEAYRNAYGVQADVIYPFIPPEKYRTETTRENVTFINPHPEKGSAIALEIARLCPDIPFSFVESWSLTPEQRGDLLNKISDLPNVRLHKAQKDMRVVYGKCKILLAPSAIEEAYGRVVTEAQISGIPVIAVARGGLPEAVGRGGLLIETNQSIDDWATALRKLWQDDAAYAELSAEALAHAQRPEMSFAYQVDAYEKVLLAAIGKQT